MGLFKSAEEMELSKALISLVNPYVQELNGSVGICEANVLSRQSQIDALADQVRKTKGSKGLAKAKREAMSYLWERLTDDPNTSFRDGSPAKIAYERFEAELDRLVSN